MENKEDPGAILFQPNLTCRYIFTKSPDRMYVLTAINKDEIGINDVQTVSALWSWTLNFNKRLIKEKSVPKKTLVPFTLGNITRNEKRDAFCVVIISKDEKLMLNDFSWVFLLKRFCREMAKPLGIDLEELDD